jgi:cell wall-associated NlpC family hydrolase
MLWLLGASGGRPVSRSWRSTRAQTCATFIHVPDPRLDLSRSTIRIPERFKKVLYDNNRYPGAPGAQGVARGANCQQYAYEFVRAFGFAIPDFRSSDLWADNANTRFSQRPKRFDLVLMHNVPDPRGAHVGVFLGNDLVLHLSKAIGVPAIESIQSMMRRAQYRHLLGFKRILVRQPKR